MEDTTHSELFLSFTGDNSRPKIIYRFIIKTMLSFEGHKYIAYFCQFLTFFYNVCVIRFNLIFFFKSFIEKNTKLKLKRLNEASKPKFSLCLHISTILEYMCTYIITDSPSWLYQEYYAMTLGLVAHCFVTAPYWIILIHEKWLKTAMA